jgi:hypothetical protein
MKMILCSLCSVLTKNEDGGDENKELSHLLDWARPMKISNPRHETITLDDLDDGQYTIPTIPARSGPSDPDITTVKDEDNEEAPLTARL